MRAAIYFLLLASIFTACFHHSDAKGGGGRGSGSRGSSSSSRGSSSSSRGSSSSSSSSSKGTSSSGYGSSSSSGSPSSGRGSSSSGGSGGYGSPGGYGHSGTYGKGGSGSKSKGIMGSKAASTATKIAGAYVGYKVAKKGLKYSSFGGGGWRRHHYYYHNNYWATRPVFVPVGRYQGRHYDRENNERVLCYECTGKNNDACVTRPEGGLISRRACPPAHYCAVIRTEIPATPPNQEPVTQPSTTNSTTSTAGLILNATEPTFAMISNATAESTTAMILNATESTTELVIRPDGSTTSTTDLISNVTAETTTELVIRPDTQYVVYLANGPMTEEQCAALTMMPVPYFISDPDSWMETLGRGTGCKFRRRTNVVGIRTDVSEGSSSNGDEVLIERTCKPISSLDNFDLFMTPSVVGGNTKKYSTYCNSDLCNAGDGRLRCYECEGTGIDHPCMLRPTVIAKVAICQPNEFCHIIRTVSLLNTTEDEPVTIQMNVTRGCKPYPLKDEDFEINAGGDTLSGMATLSCASDLCNSMDAHMLSKPLTDAEFQELKLELNEVDSASGIAMSLTTICLTVLVASLLM